jgi:alpha-ketoglutaric semialdehyde dehydrogenase
MINLQGKLIIGGTWVQGSGENTFVISPLTQRALEPGFHQASLEQTMLAAQAAADAFPDYAQNSPESRATFLETIALKIEALGEELLLRANQETGLPLTRLTGERARTCGQLRLFAEVVREGSWVDARIDTALPDRTPLPRPDLRRMLIPLGSVVVFGSSNFPLAFSVAGGDTASALAAGNPVIVKAHSGHPGTSEMIASAILAAIQECGMPSGVFSMLHGRGETVGIELVRQPAVKAVGFTGSQTAGRALFDAAASRPDPIPVFAEMASLNPVFALPRLLEERGSAFAKGLFDSVTLGGGQFCTKPGLILGIESPAWKNMVKEFGRLIARGSATTMLNAGIFESYKNAKAELCRRKGVHILAESTSAADPTKTESLPAAGLISGEEFLADPACGEIEVFGPFCLFVAARSAVQLLEISAHLIGQLTATIHFSGDDDVLVKSLLHSATRKSGRIIFNGFPTGVEVCPSMHHGGPYPATSDTRFTSVGTAAMLRFARPICLQNSPETLLPEELQSGNPRHIMRLVNNELTRKALP